MGESNETVWGRLRGADDYIQYSGLLKAGESQAPRVSLELKFVPPHPFLVNMPEHHHIHADSVTEAYAKLVAFLDEYDVDLM